MTKKSKCEYPLNELFKLEKEKKMDVSKLHIKHRICYYPQTDSVVIKRSISVISEDESLSVYGDFEILSPTDAPLRHPSKFVNPAFGNMYEEKTLIQAAVRLTPGELLFCRKHGPVARFLRGLVRKAMETENFTADELQSTI